MIGLAEPPPIVAAILRALIGMNDSSAGSTTAYGHQHCVEYELAGYRRSRRPPDDLSGEQIHDYGQVEPALPGANVRNIRNPSLVRARDVEIALEDVRYQLRRLGCRAVPGSISSDCSNLVNAHQSHHTVLAAGLSGLPKVEEYSGCSVDPVTRCERRADQPQEPNVLEGSLTDRLLKPGVVTARSHLQHPAHLTNLEAILVGFDKFVDLTDLPRTRFRTHRHSSAPVTPLASRVHKMLGTPWQPFLCLQQTYSLLGLRRRASQTRCQIFLPCLPARACRFLGTFSTMPGFAAHPAIAPISRNIATRISRYPLWLSNSKR